MCYIIVSSERANIYATSALFTHFFHTTMIRFASKYRKHARCFLERTLFSLSARTNRSAGLRESHVTLMLQTRNFVLLDDLEYFGAWHNWKKGSKPNRQSKVARSQNCLENIVVNYDILRNCTIKIFALNNNSLFPLSKFWMKFAFQCNFFIMMRCNRKNSFKGMLFLRNVYQCLK